MFGFLAPLLSKITASAIGKAAVGGVVSAVASNIGRKTTKPRIDFQGMRDDAQRAGFNPLTVLRSGGMSGYMIPAMSKQSFAGQMLGGAMTGAFDAWANKDIEEYNAEVRRLDIEQRKADLSISRSTIAQMNRPPERDFMQDYLDDPAGFTPMKAIAGHDIMVRNDILYRLGLPPGALYGIAEDAEAIFGEVGGEVTGVGNIGDTFSHPIVTDPIQVTTLDEPSLLSQTFLGEMALAPFEMQQSGFLSKAWLDSLLEPLEENWSLGTPNLSGLAY